MAAEQASAKTEQDQLVTSGENMANWPNTGDSNNMSPSVFYNSQPSGQDNAPATTTATTTATMTTTANQNEPTVPEQSDKSTMQNSDSNNRTTAAIELQESIDKQPSNNDPTENIQPNTQPQHDVNAAATPATGETIPVQHSEPLPEAVQVSASIPVSVATSATATPVVPTTLGVTVTSTTTSAPTKMEPANEVQSLPPLPTTMAPVTLPSVAMNSPAISTAPLQTMVVSSSPGVTAFTPAGSTHPSIHPQPGQPLDLHENGNLLQQYGAPTAEAVDGVLGTNVGQTTSPSTGLVTQQMVTETTSQGMALHVTSNGQPMPPPAPGHAVRVVTATGQPELQATTQPTMMDMPKDIRKTQRLPGTKQCPSCQGTIAAAVAKCPKCGHVFRVKKEKPRRSGKRGKKNCPKCSFENPSACSTCKNCKYVFRLKLMDRYKQMRPRVNDVSTAAMTAAAAHVTAMAQSQAMTAAPPAPAPISTVPAASTVPMGQGVPQYHPQIPMSQGISQGISQGFPVVNAVPAISTAPVQAVHMTSTQMNVVQHHGGMTTQPIIQQAQAGMQPNIHPHQSHPSL